MPGTYISSAETGFYYLNSRYYDAETCRFLNADGYVSTGQGVLGNNMYAYCGNNPIVNVDSTGTRYEYGAGGGFGGYAYAGPSPSATTGEVVGQTVAAAMSIYLLRSLGTDALREEKFLIKAQTRTKERVDATAIATTSEPEDGTIYYHVTTLGNAVSIALSGSMIGNKWEGGYIHAWRNYPSQYAIKHSGATQTGVIIMFKTNTLFMDDKGIKNSEVNRYKPVVSTRPGPITVWDVAVVGVTE